MYPIVKRSPRAAKRFNARCEALRENFHELGAMFIEKYGERKLFEFQHSIARKWVTARLTRDGQRLRVLRECFDERRKDLNPYASDFQIHDSVYELSRSWGAELKRE